MGPWHEGETTRGLRRATTMHACAYTLTDKNILTCSGWDKIRLYCVYWCVFVEEEWGIPVWFVCLCICTLWYVWLFAPGRQKLNESVVPGVWGFMCRHLHFICHFTSLRPFEASTKNNKVSDNIFSAQATIFPVLPSSVEDFEEWPRYMLTLALILLPIVIFPPLQFEAGRSVQFSVLFQRLPSGLNIKYLNRSEPDSHYCCVNEDLRQALTQW